MLRWGDRNKTKLVEECEAMFAQLHEMAKRGKQRRSAYRTSIYYDLADVAKKRLMLDQNAKLKRIALQSIATWLFFISLASSSTNFARARTRSIAMVSTSTTPVKIPVSSEGSAARCRPFCSTELST